MNTNEMTDEQLDFWGDVFTKSNAVSLVPFHAFLESPYRYLRVLGQEDAPSAIRNGYAPLLPAQVAVVQRLRAEYNIDGGYRDPCSIEICETANEPLAAPLVKYH